MSKFKESLKEELKEEVGDLIYEKVKEEVRSKINERYESGVDKLLAFSISFVFGAKGILKDILSSSYNKNNYKPGQKVIVDVFEGEIVKITNTFVILKSKSKVRVIPASRFTEDFVDIVG